MQPLQDYVIACLDGIDRDSIPEETAKRIATKISTGYRLDIEPKLVNAVIKDIINGVLIIQ